MPKSKYETGSCLHRVHIKQSLRPQDMCSKCQELEQKPKSFFLQKSNSYYGCCLLFHNAADSQGPQELPSEERYPKRSSSTKSINRFTACPSGGSHHMQTNQYRPKAVRDLRNKRPPLRNLPPQKNLTRIQRKRKLVDYTGDEKVAVPQRGKSRAAEARMKESLGKVLDQTGRLFFPECSTVKRTRLMRHVSQKITPRRIGGEKCKDVATPSTDEYRKLRHNDPATASKAKTPSATRSPCLPRTPDDGDPFSYYPTIEESPSHGHSPIGHSFISTVPNCTSNQGHGEEQRPPDAYVPSSAANQDSECDSERAKRPSEAEVTFQGSESNTGGEQRSSALEAEETSATTTITTTTKSKQKVGKWKAKHERMVAGVKADLGKLIPLLQSDEKYSKAKDARPLLALVGSGEYTMAAVAQATGRKLNSCEWTKIKTHYRHPGPLALVEPNEIYRQRIPSTFLTSLLSFLDSSAVTQRYAYGNKVKELLIGGTANMDNVSLRTSILAATEQFLMVVFEKFEKHLESLQDLPPDESRCPKLEKGGRDRQCMKCKDHDGKCHFTPKGSISSTSVRMLLESLTTNDICTLAALDDVKVLKGKENWKSAKAIVEELYGNDTEGAAKMIERVDKSELFHLTDFVPHLSRESDYKCNCLTCGFCEEGMDISCPKMGQHGPSCTRCTESFAIFQELLHLVERKDAEMDSRETPPSTLELQKLDQQRCDLNQCIDNLIAYRGHLARHAAEDEEAMKSFSSLEDDTAYVVSDWKMKIIAMYFRECQREFFGKRGTCCIGFMIATNPVDEESKAKGLKDVRFVMMVTDDQCQDDWAVACAKSYIYENCLPEHIKKVIFTADGAGCFKSKLHRAIQGLWKYWTGVDEVVYRLSPAGDGKTELDGMFGRMSQIMQSSVVKNQSSFHDCDSILQTLDQSNGLSATTFVGFDPDRENQLVADLADTNDKWSSSILTTKLTKGCSCSTYELARAFRHTGYGNGEAVQCDRFDLFLRDKSVVKGKKYSKDDKVSFHDAEGTLEIEKVKKFKPEWRRIRSVSNKKEAISSVATQRDGTGANSDAVRAKKRQNRIQAKSQKKAEAALGKREVIRSKGLFLCDKRCPTTKAFCRRICLDEKGLEKHLDSGTCDFPKANARDLVLLQASRPGGSLANGSRPDRRSTTLSEEILPALIPCTPAEVAARGYRAFNRPDEVESKLKTDGMLRFLLDQYGLPNKQDPRAQHDTMKTKIDPVDHGLMYCSKKAKIQRNGWVLSVQVITSWVSGEVKKRESGKISGESRVASLSKHLAKIQEHKKNNPSSYWKIPGMKSAILTSMLFLLDIPASKLNVTDKRQALIDLQLDQSALDDALEDVAKRIKLLKDAMKNSIREGENVSLSW